MAFLVALFSIAGLVWLVPLIRNSELVRIALVVLGLGTVLGPSFFAIEGPVQISLDRVLWLLMFAVAAVQWRLGRLRMPRLTRIDLLVLAIVVWFFFSALRGGPVPTGSSPVARWLFYIVMPTGMYVLARWVQISTRDVQWLMGAALALTGYLAVTALFELVQWHALVFPRFISDAEVWQFYGRGRGPLMNPCGNGILMTIGLVVAGLGIVYASARGKLVYALLSLLLWAGIYATLTRSVWMGAVLAWGVIFLIYSPRWLRVLGLAMVMSLGVASVAGVKDQLMQMKRDEKLTAADAAKSVQLRPLLAVVAWEMFQDHPLIGHGYGHYFEHNDRYHHNRSYGLPLEQARPYAQHNVALSILVDTGAIGLFLVSGWLLLLAGVGWRLARDSASRPAMRQIGVLLIGTITAYAINGMFHDVMIIPMVHMFLFFLAGVAVSIWQKGLVVATVAAVAGQGREQPRLHRHQIDEGLAT